jgi:hypothetical protein
MSSAPPKKSFLKFVAVRSLELLESTVEKLGLTSNFTAASAAPEPSQFNKTFIKNKGNILRNYFEYRNWSTTLIPRSIPVLSFDETTDLSKWRVLNDNNFGGSTKCDIKLNSYEKQIETSPGSNEFELKTVHTLVFSGYLQPLRPFKANSRWKDELHGIEDKLSKEKFQQIKEFHAQNNSNPTQKDRELALKGIKMQSQLYAEASKAAKDQELANIPPEQQTTLQKLGSALTNRLNGNELGARQPYVVDRPPPGFVHGFCAIISPDFEWPDLNLSNYHYLSCRMRVDNRRYLFNIRCNERIPHVYQSLLRNPHEISEFQKLEVKLANMVCTLNGRAKNIQTALPSRDIQSFGLSISGPEGPFQLELESITAHRGIPDWERRESSPAYCDYIDSQVADRSYNKHILGLGLGGLGGMLNDKQVFEDRRRIAAEYEQTLKEYDNSEAHKQQQQLTARQQRNEKRAKALQQISEAEKMRRLTVDVLRPSVEDIGEGMSKEENEEKEKSYKELQAKLAKEKEDEEREESSENNNHKTKP